MGLLNWARLSKEWYECLAPEFSSPYFKTLDNFLKVRLDEGAIIYPSHDDIFKSLEVTIPSKVKVVILGQDPYHGPRQAHGLSFSVPDGVALPPSLKNIFKEVINDQGSMSLTSGNLSDWAKQGVLLLNRVLTVEEGKAGSHQGKGWETFTEAVLKVLANSDQPLVLMLWGSQAQTIRHLFGKPQHLVLTAPHPSPLSSYRGFFGCRHFSKANLHLKSYGLLPIEW